MRKLKRALLVNWMYFNNQIIDFDDITFFTGPNSSGKSSVIDAMQVVLLGEKYGIFNKAAYDKSLRTLNGYLYADDGSGCNSRYGCGGFVSYIALEFHDEGNNRDFTAGAVFEVTSTEGVGNDKYFIYGGKIPEDHFIRKDGPMRISELRKYLNDNYKDRDKNGKASFVEFHDTNKNYKEALKARFNVHTDRYFFLLKKGVAFDLITNIQQFITENICDIEDSKKNIDIDKMQENIREYQKQISIVSELEKRIDYLKEIHAAWEACQKEERNLHVQEYYISRATYDERQQKIDKLSKDTEELLASITKINKDRVEAGRQIKAAEAEIEKLQQDQRYTDTSSKWVELQGKIENNNRQISELARRIKDTVSSYQRRIAAFYNTIYTGKALIFKDLGDGELAARYEELESELAPLNTLTTDTFLNVPASSWSMLADKVRVFKNGIDEYRHGIKSQLDKAILDYKETESRIAQLQNGRKLYDTGLLCFIKDLEEEYYRRTSQDLGAKIFADLLEVRDEDWHNAIEGYLANRRFYLIVDSDKFKTASRIFKEMKKSNRYNFNTIGLVDIRRIREKEKGSPEADSLALKLITEDKDAQVYLDYVLGRVICCDSIEQLNQHHTSIMKDGMLYASYVQSQIPQSRWSDQYIGQKSIEMMLAREMQRKGELGEEINRLEPLYNALDAIYRCDFITSADIDSINRCLEDYARKNALAVENEKISKEKDSLDLGYIATVTKKIKQKKDEMDGFRKRELDLATEFGEKTALAEKNDTEKMDLEAGLNDLKIQYESIIPLLEHPDETAARYDQAVSKAESIGQFISNYTSSLNRAKSAIEKKRDAYNDLKIRFGERFEVGNLDPIKSTQDDYDAELNSLLDTRLPERKKQVEDAEKKAEIEFRNDFINKIYSCFQTVTEQVTNLNRTLKKGHFGKDRYEFIVTPNPDTIDFYTIIQDLGSTRDNALLNYMDSDKYHDKIAELFKLMSSGDAEQVNKRRQTELEQNIDRYTDYRTYLTFDIKVTDSNGNSQMLSKTLRSKSGGESQTPFYIAMVAAFTQLYKVYDKNPTQSNTIRLVIFDEAFNKMDNERTKECIGLFRKCGLQAVIAAPTDKLPYIGTEADITNIMKNENHHMSVYPCGKGFMEKYEAEHNLYEDIDEDVAYEELMSEVSVDE